MNTEETNVPEIQTQTKNVEPHEEESSSGVFLFTVNNSDKVLGKAYNQGRPQDFSLRGAKKFRNNTFSGIRNKSKEKGSTLKKRGKN